MKRLSRMISRHAVADNLRRFDKKAKVVGHLIGKPSINTLRQRPIESSVNSNRSENRILGICWQTLLRKL